MHVIQNSYLCLFYSGKTTEFRKSFNDSCSQTPAISSHHKIHFTYTYTDYVLCELTHHVKSDQHL